MKGFFTKETVRKRKPMEANPCQACGLREGCISPAMPPSGDGEKKVLVIAEAPGADEDAENTQLIGDAGQLMDQKMYDLADIDLHADCWKINAVNCRPPKNRKPTAKEIDCCRSYMVHETIKNLKPLFIIPAGGAAIESLYKPFFSNCAINRWRGNIIRDPRYNAWVLPVLHPSYYLRNKTDKNMTTVFDRDMKKIGSFVAAKTKRPKIYDFEQYVTIGSDFDQVCAELEGLLSKRQTEIFFDYEATSLKPFGPEQRIWSISFSYTPEDAFAFPLAYPHWNEKQYETIFDLWRKVLLAQRIKKIAHGAKFEDNWSRAIFNIPHVRGWSACTMLTAHNMDVRKGNAGLKFLLFMKYGVLPYEGDVKKYISPKGGSPVNTLDKVPMPKLLKYNGIDTAGGMKIYQWQKVAVRGRLRSANQLTFEGSLALSNAQMKGIPIDEVYYVEQRQTLDERIAEVENLLLTGDIANKFQRRTKNKLKIKNKDFSASDLRTVFYNILKIKPTKLTGKSQQPAIDKEVLSEIDHPFAQQILERRKLVKMRDTYISSFVREISPDGRLHPFYDLHTTRTHRSSSSNPNFQNIPNREEEAKALIRKGIYPSRGRRIGAVDYGSIEVRILACCTKDPALIAYINNPETDMHRDEATQLFVLEDIDIHPKLLKTLRSWVKNQWVFPEFYGSYYVTCAKNMYDLCFDELVAEDYTVRQHLIDQGIIDPNPKRMTKVERYNHKVSMPRQLADWESHVQAHEEEFWEKYHVSREWQDRQTRFYQKHGYVELLTGHRRGELLNRNKIYNTPVQGTAFQCLLWSYTKLDKIAENNWKTNLFGQIHDEILFDIHPKETNKVLLTTERVMCHDIREHFDWIIVPLVIEPELTPIDGAWYYKEAVDMPTPKRRKKRRT